LLFIEQHELLTRFDLGAGHDLGAAVGVAGEESVIADHVAVPPTGAASRASWQWDQRTEPGDEVERREEHGRGAVSPA